MNKKLTVTVTVLAGLMFGAGATTIADNVWLGHQNIVETKKNIDKLTAKINASQSSLSDLKHQLSDAQAQYSALKQQYNNDMASLNKITLNQQRYPQDITKSFRN